MSQRTEEIGPFELAFYENVLEHNPSDTSVIEMLAAIYTESGRIDDGLVMDKRLVELEPKNASAHYNLACSLALKSDNAGALDSLKRAVALGYHDTDWMREDPDLADLQGHPMFEALIHEIKSKR